MVRHFAFIGAWKISNCDIQTTDHDGLCYRVGSASYTVHTGPSKRSISNNGVSYKVFLVKNQSGFSTKNQAKKALASHIGPYYCDNIDNLMYMKPLPFHYEATIDKIYQE